MEYEFLVPIPTRPPVCATTAKVKQLVINADDFGLDPAINAAVIQAHTTGLLTSASLLVTAPQAGEAIELARQHPTLGVGLHLCLVQGRAAEATVLCGDDGRLPSGPRELSARIARDPRVLRAIEQEMRVQLDRFLATGLRPTHLDSHMHTHMHPRILPLVIRLAREHGIDWVRAPREELWRSIRSGGANQPLRLAARWPIFAVLGGRALRRLRAAGIHTTDRAVGVLNPGHLIEPYVARYLERLPDGLTEMFFHPATETTPTLGTSQSGYQHSGELAALCSPQVKAIIERTGINLVNFGGLPVVRPASQRPNWPSYFAR
jgi:chitin disaccharide deacetylase